MPLLSPDHALSAQDPWALVGLAVAGALGAAQNAIAGGGSLISFPTMVALGMPALAANATNSAALTLGNLASAVGYWRQLRGFGALVGRLLVPTVVGSLLGAWLLTRTTERAFGIAVPLLLLLATALLGWQPQIRRRIGAGLGHAPVALGVGLQIGVSVYGGYFGAGMGILMLAVLSLLNPGSLHQHNAVKNWLSVAINVVAAAFLVLRGLVWLWPALAVALGAVTGGWFGARLAQRVAPEPLRRGIVVLGAVMTLWFTWRAWRH